MPVVKGSMRKSCICVFLIAVSLTLNMVCLNAKNLTVSFLPAITYGEGKKYVGAFAYAIKQANAGKMSHGDEKLLHNLDQEYRLRYEYFDTRRREKLSLRAIADHRYLHEAIAYFGPEEKCVSGAKLAGALELPMIGYKCSDSELSDKVNFPTFARTLMPTTKVTKSIIAVMKYFKWKKYTPIAYVAPKWKTTAETLIDLSWKFELEPNDLEIYRWPYYNKTSSKNPKSKGNLTSFDPRRIRKDMNTKYLEEIRSIIRKTKDTTRIYVFLGEKIEMIDFLRELSAEVKEDAKHYVVLTVDLKDSKRTYPDYLIKDGVESIYNLPSHVNITEAFRFALILSPRDPASSDKRYDIFKNESKKLGYEAFPIPKPIKGYMPFSETIATALYDAVYIYVRALHEVLKEGISAPNGTEVFKKMINRTFESIRGHSVNIDINGDAEGNFTLLALKHHDSPLGNKTNWTIESVGSFKQEELSDIPVFQEKGTIQWLLGHSPPDEPLCGFDKKKCDHKFDWTIAAICMISACVIAIATIFACRHYLYEQKLASLTWKIDFREIMRTENLEETQPVVSGKPKRKCYNQYSFLSLAPEEHSEKPARQAYTKIGSYKGIVVSMKFLKKKHVEINRTIKKELQLMQKINHDNINRFIGACVDPPNICIVQQYCARGSIFDILKNDNKIKLDDIFIASLVSDLIKGMIYIHESEIGFHGNLRSTNCLVDSRWVLQISGFGLHHFKADSSAMYDEESYYRKLLWRAPELLRTPNCQGTPKGDIYSFAIIMHELTSLGEPWGYPKLSPKDIVRKVKNPLDDDDEYFRPNLEVIKKTWDFIVKCLEDCWYEDPDLRPDFKFIRMRLKPMQQGLRSNIIDNMVSLLEKHATNLEALVDQRTQQLVEEKKKTEALLHKLLPKSVAEQLKIGHPVVPEQYEQVTIYFSDIVGFTALSASSTPMEVVDLLNDLYTLFDSIIGHFDVYKVETIGDAYMVVSGLPIRNDDNHAGEIASMSLRLLKAIMTFKARHRPDETIQLRIGIHSGPCVAGVVGLKMPRYCLFGDTVNTASRMESNGVGLKIHCSGECRAILDKLGGYILQERGLVNMKGKGEMLTYFLVGEDENHRLRRISKDHSMIKKIDLNPYGKFAKRNSCGSVLSRFSYDFEDDLCVGPSSALLVNGSLPNDGVLKHASSEHLV